jgi:EAL domain-containing protein (putative c-di-GMP-specific phosphodiesterase class I)
VTGLDGSPGTIVLVEAMTKLLHTLGLSIIAEGIETSAQLDTIAGLHCHQAQGYDLGMPSEPTGIDDLLGKRASLPTPTSLTQTALGNRAAASRALSYGN